MYVRRKHEMMKAISVNVIGTAQAKHAKGH